MQRINFKFNDTGTAEYKHSANGSIVQVRWSPTSTDTGADFVMSVLPSQADTGEGFDVFSVNGSAQFTKYGGVQDTGNDPVVVAGDDIRVRSFGAATNTLVGSFYVWVK